MTFISQIVPSPTLEWTACYGEFSCARLSVPLDYNDVTAGNAAIALIKYPSVVPHNEEGYMGPVLFNPGKCQNPHTDFIADVEVH